ncbi:MULTISPECIES: putative metalloprotease CJM1_0395 family protein [Shewanella]|uniref:putative metalloprotease CJM1_0395 family protein n=1 Tax=Shewanella TaxID=22 RepID=UPI003AABD6AA
MDAVFRSATMSTVSSAMTQRGSFLTSANLASTTPTSTTLAAINSPNQGSTPRIALTLPAQLTSNQQSTAHFNLPVQATELTIAEQDVVASPVTSTQTGTASYSLKRGPLSISAVLQQTPPSSTTNESSSDTSGLNISTNNEHTHIAPYLSEQNQASGSGASAADASAQSGSPIAQPLTPVEDTYDPFAALERDPVSGTGQSITEQTDHKDAGQNDADDEQQQVDKQIEQKQQQIELAEAQQIAELAKRDIEVKTHEQAHAAVGGSLAQSPRYEYEKGPDGRRYAVEGEVSIDVSIVSGDPQATINKMQKVYAAAMAPVQPSMADIRVAAQALQNINEAKQALTVQRQQSIISIEDNEQLIALGNLFQDTDSSDPLSPFMKDPSASEHNQLDAAVVTASQSTLRANDSANTPLNDTNRAALNSNTRSSVNQDERPPIRYNPYQAPLNRSSNPSALHGVELYV